MEKLTVAQAEMINVAFLSPLALLALMILASCGGDGGFARLHSPSGVWEGKAVSLAVSNDILCLIAESRELACLLTDTITDEVTAAAGGTVQVTDTDQVSGSGVLYAAPGFVLADGSLVTDFTITGGTARERESLDLTVEAAGTIATISAAYDSIYDRDSSLATVEGTYAVSAISGNESSFSIDPNGTLFAQTESGCVVQGPVGIIDGRFNAYDVELVVSGLCRTRWKL